MQALFDTNVLIGCMISTHLHHDPSKKIVEKVAMGKIEGYISAHTIAETYATLTSYPSHPSFSCQGANKMIDLNIKNIFKIVDLSIKDYFDAVKRTQIFNVRSGGIYDALILQACLKKKIKKIYTWNIKHYTRMIEDNEIEVLEP